jgi:tetratricopeptide (TPR) repeat protein
VEGATAPSVVETELLRVQQLLRSGDSAGALHAVNSLLTRVPENRDALYLLALSQRRAGQPRTALKTLERLAQLHPRFARLYEERGHCQMALGSASAAIESYRSAVGLNESLLDSWRALEQLCRTNGLNAEADIARDRSSALAGMPVELRAAYVWLGDGQIALAEEAVRAYLQAHGEHVDALRLLARIALHFDAAYDAELLLERATALAPQGQLRARHDYAVILLERQKHPEALAQLEVLLKHDPSNLGWRSMVAAAHAGLGDFERALPMYEELARAAPGEPALNLTMGHALKALGRAPAAIESYRSAAAARHAYGEAWWGLANLKTYRFRSEEIERMRQLEADESVSLTDRYHLCFALGKGLEDAGAYEQAFEYYERGNRLKRTELRYDAAALERLARYQTSSCDAEFFRSRSGFGAPSDAPIFIIGLPRSGSTLVEQILAAHSAVEGTQELPLIPRLVHEMQARGTSDPEKAYPRVLAHLTEEMCRGLGERYLREAAPYRSGRARFIDKMPNNFRHLALVHLMLPQARIIDVRREPMACGFAIYKQLFAAGQLFAYSLEDIAHYYRLYVDLMDHWERALPGRILRVQYETLIDDFEPQVRRMLDFCALPFEDACLEFHRAERTIHSASSEQVRQPINRDGIDQWRHFERWLEPLKVGLGPLASGAAA